MNARLEEMEFKCEFCGENVTADECVDCGLEVYLCLDCANELESRRIA